MKTPHLIRAATPADLPAIRDLHISSWRETYRGQLDEGFLGAPLATEMSRRWSGLPPAPDMLLVAVDDAGLRGFAYVRFGHPDGPVLDNLHVDATRRGGGIGAGLMRAAAHELRRRGQDRLWLDVLDANHAARRFYARMGGLEGAIFSDDLVGNKVSSRKVVWPSLAPLLPG